MQNENAVFARNLRAARERVGMSQQELADKLGVKRQDVGHWESGRHLPRLPVARRLAQVLGVTLESLFDEEGPEYREAPAEQVTREQAGGAEPQPIPAPDMLEPTTPDWDAPPASGPAPSLQEILRRIEEQERRIQELERKLGKDR